MDGCFIISYGDVIGPTPSTQENNTVNENTMTSLKIAFTVEFNCELQPKSRLLKKKQVNNFKRLFHHLKNIYRVFGSHSLESWKILKQEMANDWAWCV